MPVPYYDADHTVLAYLSENKAARYEAAGTATAVRTKAGRIVRLYRRTAARTYPSVAAAITAMHAGASQTTTRVRDAAGVQIAPPQHREHRRPDAGWSGARHDGDER